MDLISEDLKRLRSGLDVEKVTKKFYEFFKTEHKAFLDFLKGIPDEDMERWYVSVMINRLMFIYFIQKKSFLNGDIDYLRNKLADSKKKGKNLYYKNFLCPLFFEGFAKKESDRSPETSKLLGDVPYLNGGLFLRHQIEELHGKDIQIPDAAFERLFEFFEKYQWHLDERPLEEGNEINPDVLGYIFEKYINQKQMGAYYTKEDITEYISKNTVIPFLFDAAKQKCKIAFEGEHSVWNILQADPASYIYEALKKGAELELPGDIAAGRKDVSKRTGWNKPASAEYALPTETWREVVVRRQRYEDVRAKLAAGEIKSINDLITYNLDIRRFAQDVIENCEGPELLRAFYHAIDKVTVLDPTCGSGAFLFAALNILEPLYETCLNRMQGFLDDSGEKHPEKFNDFRKVLEQVAKHPNRRYFILKSIVINNLYGVDIMEEAVEICKLRLFLKLVAQVEEAEKIEPLPDIDFNIRAGNTLVGYASYDDVKRAVTSKFDFDNAMGRIDENADIADRAFQMFREMQTEHGMDSIKFLETKAELRKRLNRYIAEEYGIDVNKKDTYEKWIASYLPFHWFIDFYRIIKSGGFDAIIGNPPYIEYSKIRNEYKINGYDTEECGNLYAYVLELSHKILSGSGRIGMIVPLSIASTERMSSLQAMLSKTKRTIWYSFFDVYPCKLFEGAKQRLSIVIESSKEKQETIFTTKYNRWKTPERNTLISTMSYWPSTYLQGLSSIPKLSCKLTESILNKINKKSAATYNQKAAHTSYWVHRIPYNYIKAFNFVPYFWNEVDGEKKSEDYKPYSLRNNKDDKVALAILNSTTFFWWWYTLFEGYHCGKHEIFGFPMGLDNIPDDLRNQLEKLPSNLMDSIRENKSRKECQYKSTGVVIYDEFYPQLSKPIIDKIDKLLAHHYGFNNEEVDFIINYDIKYRMSQDSIDS